MVIRGEKELIRQLRAAQSELLPDLVAPVDAAARGSLTHAMLFVPVQTGELITETYVDPAHVNEADHVVGASAGFEHPHAAEIHEGFRRGGKKVAPPHFMTKGAQLAKPAFRKALVATVKATLSRIFQDKEK